MEWDFNKQIRAASAVISALYLTVIVKRELSQKVTWKQTAELRGLGAP